MENNSRYYPIILITEKHGCISAVLSVSLSNSLLHSPDDPDDLADYL